MPTPKKKHLIELMIEAGVKWPDGAEYAAQDKCDNKVYFFDNKPTVQTRSGRFVAHGGAIKNYLLPSLCLNWHQTIVTRERYAKALSEHTGDTTFTGKSNQVRESEDIPAGDAAEWHNPPSIEQLTADYHAKAAEADRLQAVADEALKAADNALVALEKAGELIGLVISIDTSPKHKERPTTITDWSDLSVGDVIECIEPWGGSIECGDFGFITGIDSIELTAKFEKQEHYYYKRDHLGVKFRFIRRP